MYENKKNSEEYIIIWSLISGTWGSERKNIFLSTQLVLELCLSGLY